MGYQPVTPFRRMMDAALVNRALASVEPPPAPADRPNKWEILRDLSEARHAWGLSDRDLTVLQALLSFHPQPMLEGESLVVHPSNASICQRLNGMPLSTMRRHLANLVASGVIARRDSPNGKRYARRGDGAFGFDLSPLVRQHRSFRDEAEAVRAARDALKRQRESLSLMRRDLAALADWGQAMQPEAPLWQSAQSLAIEAARLLRRKLDVAQLSELEARLSHALDQARDALSPAKPEEMSTRDAENERHYQNSKKELPESEEAADDALVDARQAVNDEAEKRRGMPVVPLRLVVSACPEAATYADRPIRHWHDLLRTAESVRPMMGITASCWEEAKTALGSEEASVVLLAMLERFSDLRSPGGYLRTLARKAVDGSFSSGPMVMALLRKTA